MSAQPAAAWYPDPTQPEQLRWWDGSTWTAHVHPAAQAAQAAPAAAAAPVASATPRATHPLEQLHDASQWTSFPDADAAVHDVSALGDAELAERSTGTRKQLVLVISASAVAIVTGLGWLIGVGIVTYVVWYLVKHGVVSGKHVEATHDAWCRERGLEPFRLAASGFRRAEPGPLALVLEKLRHAGFDKTLLRAFGARGRLWGATGPAILGDVTYRVGDDDSETLSIVAITLPEQVANRYPGVAMEVRPHGVLGKVMDARRVALSRDWKPVRFEHELPGIQVLAAPSQEELALWELFDPRVVDDLARRAQIVAPLGFGFVVSRGMLIAWRPAVPIGQILLRAARTVDAAKVAAADREFESWLDTVRTLHRRLLEEYR